MWVKHTTAGICRVYGDGLSYGQVTRNTINSLKAQGYIWEGWSPEPGPCDPEFIDLGFED